MIKQVLVVATVLVQIACAIHEPLLELDPSTPYYKSEQFDWSGVDKVLDAAIADDAFPGCVAIAGDSSGIIYAKPFGHFTYGVPPPQNSENPKMTLDTLFDMASCTKVSATTSAVAQFYQRGELPLHTKVVEILGEEYGSQGKEPITILNLLLHNAGYPPDPNPNYWDKSFGCPETMKKEPLENFSCQKQIYASLLNQKLMNPIGEVYVYSDLSFITLMYVVGTLAKELKYVNANDLIPGCDTDGNPGTSMCYYEAYVRKYVFSSLQMTSSGFLPNKDVWQFAAPTENDTSYLNRVIQGQVSDGNAYALGGIAGHAGVFSNAPDMFKLMYKIMFATEHDSFLNKTTVDLFTTEYNHTQSSRALGWNTNDPGAFDMGWNLSCGSMSPRTFMHTGFTGTELCGDMDRKLITVFLTNRVYPSQDNDKIRIVRQQFGTAVVNAYEHKQRENFNNHVARKTWRRRE